jgi:hypothetical protein
VRSGPFGLKRLRGYTCTGIPHHLQHSPASLVEMTEVIEETVTCPLCNNNVVNARLALIGLSQEQLHFLREHVKNRTLNEILSIAEIALRRMDPERTSIEFQLNEAISKLKQVSEDMTKKSMEEAQIFSSKRNGLGAQLRNKLDLIFGFGGIHDDIGAKALPKMKPYVIC